MREVIEAVKEWRRRCLVYALIIACPEMWLTSSQRRSGAGGELSWKPKYDDLRQIVTHALSWEKKLAGRNR